ncbi:hypothetical protein V6N12_021361 [Hibiscus sabdariffa]|uniref:ClpA/ClpB AAA lid domain-containing protein n=1 Tax=Hibiscus sabdariffa TaxID=183260 RepID=A0ABR2FRN0_9ROSI
MLAHGESRRLGHNYIGTEHILLGLISGARRVLKGFFKGSRPDWSDIYDKVIYYIGKGEGSTGNTTMPALVQYGTNLTKPIEEYNEHMEKDPSLTMPSFSVDETILILKRVQVHYEIHYKLRYSDEALIAAAELSYQYITDGRLPDKAIDLIHEAGACVCARHAQFLEATRELRREFRQIIKSKNKARPIGKEAQEWEQNIYNFEELRFQIGIFHEASKAGKVVTEVDIQDIVSSWTGIPAKQVISRLVNVEETLHKQVIGQNEAVKAVIRACVGLRNSMVRSTAVA